MADVMEIKMCRSCYHNELKELLDLGEQYIINFGDKPTTSLPIVLVMCTKCKLVQSAYSYDPDLFFKHYYYKSNVNATMRKHLADLVRKTLKLVDPCPDDTVIDIGANDGELLRYYPPQLNKVGFEPAENLCTHENYPDSRIINAYFSDNWGLPKAKIITAISMLYSVPEPNLFMNSIKNTLHREGVFVTQFNYLITMLENNAVDNLSHEHLCHYSLNTLQYLLNRCELDIFRAEFNDLNGGSVRVFIKHRNCQKYEIGPEVEIIKKYVEYPYSDWEIYESFKTSVDWIGSELYSLIKAHGPVWGYGASTRGYTLLQTMGLTNKDIIAIADKNPSKQNTILKGLDIPIKSEDEWRKSGCKYTLLLPWYFQKEFLDREKQYLQNGGKFIIPLPIPRIVG